MERHEVCKQQIYYNTCITTRDNTLYEILGFPPGTGDNECIQEAAGKLLADIPFVVSYMEKFVTEEVESWNANWETHGDGREENKNLFYRTMQAYADVLPRATGGYCDSKQENKGWTKEGHCKPCAAWRHMRIIASANQNGIEEAAAHDTQISREPAHACVRT